MSPFRYSCHAFFLFFIFGLNTSFQKSFDVDYLFGICLKPNYPENLITYAVIKEKGGKRLEIRKIDERSFVLMAGGLMRSEANSEKLNLFEKHEIPYCSMYYDTVMTNHVLVCPLMERLWKLRHQSKPDNFSGGNTEDAGEMGWSGKRHSPSEAQLMMLAEFGMETINQYAKGEDCFKLLKAISDASWVAKYRGN